MKFSSKSHLSLALLAWLNSYVTYANDVETIEVYGNFNPIDVNQMPSAYFVLDKPQIDTVIGTSALDVLTLMPGIGVQTSGVSQEIFLRGAETNFLIVQIDGVQVNNPLDSRGGSFDLGALSKDVIQRVELIKGAQSSIYGSDAIAGVINFITYDADSTKTSVSYGAYSEGSHLANATLAFDNGAIRVAAISRDLDRTGEGQDSIELTAHKAMQFNHHGETTFNIRYSDYEQNALPDQSGGILYAVNSDKDRKEGQIFTGSIRHNQTVTEQYQLALQAEIYNASDRLDTPGITPYFSAPPTISDNEYSYYKLRVLNGFDLNDFYVTTGVDFKSEEGDAGGSMIMSTVSDSGDVISFELPTEYQITRENVGLFVDANWRSNDLTLYAGVRHDDTKDFGDQQTWKLGTSYQLRQNMRLFANTGTAFKLPSLYALSNNLIGNPELEPEQSRNQDVGIEYAADKVNLTLSVFNYQYTDLVDFDFATFSLVNRSKITSSGAELIMQGELSEVLSVNFDLTYVDIDTSENEILTGRPDWQGGLGFQYQINDTLNTSVQLDYVGDTVGTSQHTGQSAAYELDAYNKVDVTTQWQWQPNIRFDFYLQNTFDTKYQSVVGVPGEALGVGASVYWLID